jgi:hypothetical protein
VRLILLGDRQKRLQLRRGKIPAQVEDSHLVAVGGEAIGALSGVEMGWRADEFDLKLAAEQHVDPLQKIGVLEHPMDSDGVEFPVVVVLGVLVTPAGVVASPPDLGADLLVPPVLTDKAPSLPRGIITLHRALRLLLLLQGLVPQDGVERPEGKGDVAHVACAPNRIPQLAGQGGHSDDVVLDNAEEQIGVGLELLALQQLPLLMSQIGHIIKSACQQAPTVHEVLGVDLGVGKRGHFAVSSLGLVGFTKEQLT